MRCLQILQELKIISKINYKRRKKIDFKNQGATPAKDGPRINEEIDVEKIRCIGSDGEQLGIMPVSQAINLAEEAGLDLVEISPNTNPPVCKILDFGKYKYELQKRKNEARKKQKIIEVKEIKLRPNIDEHDYQVKLKKIYEFLDNGDKVKITMRFRGREMAHHQIGADVLKRVEEDTLEKSKIELVPKLEGRQMVMILAPK